MKARSLTGRFIRLAMVPFLAAAVGVAVAQGPPGHDDHGNNGNNGNRGNDNRGNDNHGNQGNNNFRFRDQDRGNFQSHYSKDVSRWRNKPQGRPHFTAGQRIPNNYHFQPVPRSYYNNAPPPPGYQYGYYDGYVVAYDPTSRIIADVLDLVVAGSR
ncbi:hypothetical protein [Granulicella sp. dw_53]|uniref:hypothetical protein n=1 Tax=Granulicella sp. dw_53 TaxID=2719792 RepID=UPI001BD55E93|nr:hypothetical protein [Granulicella sp. dw_53]